MENPLSSITQNGKNEIAQITFLRCNSFTIFLIGSKVEPDWPEWLLNTHRGKNGASTPEFDLTRYLYFDRKVLSSFWIFKG